MTNNEEARCFTPVFPYQRHFDGYVEMPEEDAALFWRVDTSTELCQEKRAQTQPRTQ